MADDFFSEDNKDTNSEETEKIKVGDKEYTQDELNRKLSLGEKAEELEGKWNTKIDRLMPEYTKATQDRDAFRKQLEEYKKTAVKVEDKMDAAGLTEDQKKEARKQLFDLLGDEPLTKKQFDEEVNKRVYDILSARDLISSIDDLIGDAKEAGKPATSREAMIKFMQETGERNPEWAYKKMFEKELKVWEQEQLKKAKPSPFSTIVRPATGSKSPPEPVKVTRDNMRDAVREILQRE